MKRIILFVITISLLSACSTSPAVDVFGDWTLVAYGEGSNLTDALPQVDAFISFTESQVSGNVGCNGFGGDYKVKGNTITFGSIMSTMMYCEETMAQEQGVLAALQGEVKATVNGNTLTLTSADGSVVILSRRETGY